MHVLLFSCRSVQSVREGFHGNRPDAPTSCVLLQVSQGERLRVRPSGERLEGRLGAPGFLGAGEGRLLALLFSLKYQ